MGFSTFKFSPVINRALRSFGRYNVAKNMKSLLNLPFTKIGTPKAGIVGDVSKILRKAGQANIFEDPRYQDLLDYVTQKVRKPIVVFPGGVSATIFRPEAFYISVAPPYRQEELLHELGHILTHKAKRPLFPPGMISTFAIPLINLLSKRHRLPLSLLAGGIDLAQALPYLITEYKAQQAAQTLGNVRSPVLQALANIFPLSLII